MSPIAKMRVKVVYTYPSPIKYVPDGYKTKKSVIKLLILALFYFFQFLIDISLKKYMIKLFPKNLLCKNIVSIDKKLKKYVVNLLILVCQY